MIRSVHLSGGSGLEVLYRSVRPAGGSRGPETGADTRPGGSRGPETRADTRPGGSRGPATRADTCPGGSRGPKTGAETLLTCKQTRLKMMNSSSADSLSYGLGGGGKGCLALPSSLSTVGLHQQRRNAQGPLSEL